MLMAARADTDACRRFRVGPFRRGIRERQHMLRDVRGVERRQTDADDTERLLGMTVGIDMAGDRNLNGEQ